MTTTRRRSEPASKGATEREHPFYLPRSGMKYATSKLDFARELRRRPTKAEVILWERLKKRRFAKREFKFQHLLRGWIVDFFCPTAGLVVEVDGGYHSEPEQRRKDEYRDDVLTRLGYTVIRVKNEDVEFGIDGVLVSIHRVLAAKKPPPDPART